MINRPHNPNRAFLLGSAVLAFAVIFIVVLFTMLSLRAISKHSEEEVRYQECYRFEFAKDLAGSSMSVYLNDSLLFDGVVPEGEGSKLQVNRFEEESALLVVDNETEKVSAFELSAEGGTWLINKEGETLTVTPSK